MNAKLKEWLLARAHDSLIAHRPVQLDENELLTMLGGKEQETLREAIRRSDGPAIRRVVEPYEREVAAIAEREAQTRQQVQQDLLSRVRGRGRRRS